MMAISAPAIGWPVIQSVTLRWKTSPDWVAAKAIDTREAKNRTASRPVFIAVICYISSRIKTVEGLR